MCCLPPLMEIVGLLRLSAIYLRSNPIRDFMVCATGRINHENLRAQLVYAVINDVNWVQRSIMRSNTSSSPLIPAILVSTIFWNWCILFFIPPPTSAVPVMKESERALSTDSCVAWSGCLEYSQFTSFVAVHWKSSQNCISDSISGIITAGTNRARDNEGAGHSQFSNQNAGSNLRIGSRSL